VRQVRAFNRIVAERIGVLGDGFLGRPRPMGESRTLWEIGPQGAELRDLRSRLALDSGYLSRVLRSLERQGLVAVKSSDRDGRVRVATLTRAGRLERIVLDRRSNDVALSILEPLNGEQRARLVTAMFDVERLLNASMVSFAVEAPGAPDSRWCIEQYFAELDRRFESGFDPARSISADFEELTPPRGALLFHNRAPAELKRMWVAPEVRGLGLGRRLLSELERLARTRRVRTLRLETNRSLTEAIRLYRSAGYREVHAFNAEPYADHWFEKRLG
jgi:GNAT superfamily N-acetyltransferase